MKNKVFFVLVAILVLIISIWIKKDHGGDQVVHESFVLKSDYVLRLDRLPHNNNVDNNNFPSVYPIEKDISFLIPKGSKFKGVIVTRKDGANVFILMLLEEGPYQGLFIDKRTYPIRAIASEKPIWDGEGFFTVNKDDYQKISHLSEHY